MCSLHFLKVIVDLRLCQHSESLVSTNDANFYVGATQLQKHNSIKQGSMLKMPYCEKHLA
jgi:hypothetical protein